MELFKIKNIVSTVAEINKKYDAIAKITGDNFNIFRILKIQANEVKTHSAFIAELLNPKGSHGCDDTFLKLFLDLQLRQHEKHAAFLKRFEKFETTKSSVTVEKHIGFKSTDETEGGRIDILITDNHNNAIIVENKIYAAEQKLQLVRYNNAYKHAPIFYLTLNGDDPTVSSKGELNVGDEYITISYKDDILTWLELCVKEAVNLPILRESLKQYANLIKYLTNQTINTDMKNEIAETLALNEESIKSSYAIRNSIPDMEQVLLDKLQGQMQELVKPLGLKCIFDERFGKVNEETYISFCLPGSEDIKISFGFEKWRMDFSIGIDSEPENFKSEIKEKIQESNMSTLIGPTKCVGENYKTWYYLYYFEDPKIAIWNKPEIWCEILNGKLSMQLYGYLKKIMDELKRTVILD